MTFEAVPFNSLAELNQYFLDNPHDKPIAVCTGAADNSWVVIFDTTGGASTQPAAAGEGTG